MAIEVFNRYEHKYIIDAYTYKKVADSLEEHMTIDKHNINRLPYTISNLYYDTLDDYLIRTSISKPGFKQKLRLRSYGIPTLDSKVFLEIKKKHDGIVNKRRSILRLDEAYRFMKTSSPPELADYMNGQVFREIEHFLSVYDVSAKLYLAYDRIAYFEEGNPDLRISFDTNIRSRRHHLSLEKGDFGKPLLDEGLYLMEIKTSRAKPLWLCDILSKHKIYRQSFSKYGTEYTSSFNKHFPAIHAAAES